MSANLVWLLFYQSKIINIYLLVDSILNLTFSFICHVNALLLLIGKIHLPSNDYTLLFYFSKLSYYFPKLEEE